MTNKQDEDFFFNFNMEPALDYQWNSTKNQTRISSILGPWTVYNNVKASILPYKTGAYLTMYVLCDDQMSGNSCILPFCSEFDSEVCLRTMENNASCDKMDETIVDWADAIVFIYLEYYIDLGFPYNIHEEFSTGEWVGPYQVVFGQDPDVYKEGKVTSDGRLMLDTYILKYLISPTTEYLKIPPGCTIFTPEEFSGYLGEGAVNNTVRNQATGLTFDEAFDPYFETCENGNIEPMLPFVNFTYVQNNDVNRTEELLVRFEMKLLTYPKKDTALYNLMPSLQDEGFPISGPYCYDGDPNRGYTFDLVFDSIEGTTLGTELQHACIGNYECVPPSLEGCNCTMAQNNDIIFEPIQSKKENIGLSTDIYLEIGFAILAITVIASVSYNFYMGSRIKKVRSVQESHIETINENDVIIEESEEKPKEEQEDHSMTEPLVPQNQST